MKTIDEIYKNWCGESHTTNSAHPVHDSSEAQDFAQYYYNEMIGVERNPQRNVLVIAGNHRQFKNYLIVDKYSADELELIFVKPV